MQGDRAALALLVRNLADNALRYSPPGARVELRVVHDGGGALLQVDDAGPGIPAEDRERVFDRFYRRASGDETGSGLGLAIVRSIAERHGADSHARRFAARRSARQRALTRRAERGAAP